MWQGASQPGEIAALVGLSGSGKSTLALALLRLLQYRGGEVEGSIRLQGEELVGLPAHRMRALRGKKIRLRAAEPRRSPQRTPAGAHTAR